MAVRTQLERARISLNRKNARRNVISRTARIWSKLYKHLVPDLKDIARKWLEKLIKQAVQESSSGYIDNPPELSPNFTQKLRKTLREAYAQGWWLNHLYVLELEAAYTGLRYRGRITLADTPTDEELRRILENFMNYEDLGEWESVIPQSTIDWLQNYTPTLAGNLSNSVLEGVREVMRNSLQTGSTLQERMKELRESAAELSRMTESRIESIARTEITRADTLGRLSSMKSNDDVIGVEFSAVMDDRTTEICQSRHGLVMRLDDPRLPENTPPCHVRCLLGDTLVLPIGGVSAVSERVFDGDIIVIECAGGNHLSGTPNHPILTSRGWIPLGEIKEGDYIVCDSVRERGDVINGEHQQMVTRIKDAASAFFNNCEVRATPVPVSTEDFHHDGGQSKVAVIYTDRKLCQRRESSIDKRVVKKSFVFRNIVSSFFEHCKGVLLFCFNRVGFSSFGFMSFSRKFQSFFRCCALHSCKLLFMPITRIYPVLKKYAFHSTGSSDIESLSDSPNTYTFIKQSDDSIMVDGINGTFPLNAAFEQKIIDCIVAGAVFFAKLHDADTREVIFDNVISVEQRRFCGHVYNLQTESGIFVANNIITHNCRSLLLPCTVYEYPDGLLTSHEFEEVPAGTQRTEDIQEVMKILE